MVIKKDVKENKEYYEKKIFACLEKFEKENKPVKVIDDKFVKAFIPYLNKVFKDYEIVLEDEICTIITDGYEIDIALDE